MVLEPQYSATWRAVSGLPACAHLAWMPFTWAAPTTPTTPCPSAFCPASHSRLDKHHASQISQAASACAIFVPMTPHTGQESHRARERQCLLALAAADKRGGGSDTAVTYLSEKCEPAVHQVACAFPSPGCKICIQPHCWQANARLGVEAASYSHMTDRQAGLAVMQTCTV